MYSFIIIVSFLFPITHIHTRIFLIIIPIDNLKNRKIYFNLKIDKYILMVNLIFIIHITIINYLRIWQRSFKIIWMIMIICNIQICDTSDYQTMKVWRITPMFFLIYQHCWYFISINVCFLCQDCNTMQ